LPPGLTYGGDEEPGIRRLGQKRPRYIDDRTGAAVRDPDTLARIRSLVVPPGWSAVWISGDRSNRTYGLTTLRDRHVTFGRGELTIRYLAKGSKVHEVACTDPRLCRLVRRCQDLPGQRLFQWLDDDGGRHPLSSGDVNDYLRGVTGLDAMAKTFRTWGASVFAAAGLATADQPGVTDRQRTQLVNRAIELVSDVLGNTPAVCRRSYVHPVVIDRFLAGRLARRWNAGPTRPAGGLLTEERRLLHVLRARS